MDENRLRFGVGVLVISAIGIGIILTFLFGAFPSVLKHDYSLSVVFPSATGIGANTPVVRDGVQIGRVSDIELREKGGVLVTLSMDAEQKMSHNYLPRVGTANFITSDASLEFFLADESELASVFGEDLEIVAKPYTDGEFLDYGTQSDSLFEMQNDLQATFDTIQRAGESIVIAGNSVNQLAMEVREVVGGTDSKLEGVTTEAIEALDEFQGAMTDLRSIVGNPELKDNLEKSMAKLPEMLDSTQKTFESFERVGNQFEKVGEAAEQVVSGAQQTVSNLESFTDPLAERGGELVEKVMVTLDSLNSALAEVDEFGNTLNNNEGTLKRFLEDDEIYWRLKRTIENIEQASAKIRPILDDARIFSDKIARDPRQLGVRGALTKRPSGAGFK